MTITFLEAKINVAEGQQNKLKTISLSQMGKLLQQKQQQTLVNNYKARKQLLTHLNAQMQSKQQQLKILLANN